MSMKLNTAYTLQSSRRRSRSARDQHFVRPAVELTTDQEEKEQTEHEIETDKADQREDRVAVAHHLAVAVARVEQAVDEPRLASELGRHPSERVSDVRKGERQHQD